VIVYLNKKIKDNEMLTDKEALFDEVQALYKQAWQERHILPTHVKKYAGSIHATPWNTYQCMITDKRLEKPINRNFNTYDEAFAFIKDINKQNDWTPKNVVTDYGIYMKVNLTQEQRMIFDRRNLRLIQEHNMCAAYNKLSQSFYAETSDNSKSGRSVLRVHNLIMDHTPSEITVDHFNRTTLDNRMINLRKASRATQSINKRVLKNNKIGITGVHYITTRKVYTVSYSGKRCAKTFSVYQYGDEKAKQMAIEYRKKIEKTNPVYIEAKRITEKGIDMDEDAMYDITNDLEYDYESILI